LDYIGGSIGSFSVASMDSSDDSGSIESLSNLDPLATLQEGLDEIEREITNVNKKDYLLVILKVWGQKGMIILTVTFTLLPSLVVDVKPVFISSTKTT
jgi:hypothetical protein